ncbi:MAG: twin-arginine translocase TatA/TatE family subunit [Nitrososphaerota archaeon]|nr:twin-arginine translocase TatA/TatE family subunit [Nitrososphaerota archaeon]
MALDDPVVWVLIVAVIVFLFGANKIPQIAKGIGQARREFEMASKGITDPLLNATTPTVAQSPPGANASTQTTEDPLITVAKKEGIETQGKTREQIASEIAWKLKKTSN